jgi:hypothetical protein
MLDMSVVGSREPKCMQALILSPDTSDQAMTETLSTVLECCLLAGL